MNTFNAGSVDFLKAIQLESETAVYTLTYPFI